jgi:cobyric acid synthase
MSSYATLTPAYGRDYRNKKAAEADFIAGKDFIIHLPTGHSTYASLRELRREGFTHANIRYAGQRKVTVVAIPAE